MSELKAVTDSTFEADVLNSEKPVLVDFWAEWCGPCKALTPELEKLAVEHAERIEVVQVNVDENPATAAKYGITSIPAVYAFNSGEKVKASIGAKPKPALEDEFADLLNQQ